MSIKIVAKDTFQANLKRQTTVDCLLIELLGIDNDHIGGCLWWMLDS